MGHRIDELKVETNADALRATRPAQERVVETGSPTQTMARAIECQPGNDEGVELFGHDERRLGRRFGNPELAGRDQVVERRLVKRQSRSIDARVTDDRALLAQVFVEPAQVDL